MSAPDLKKYVNPDGKKVGIKEMIRDCLICTWFTKKEANNFVDDFEKSVLQEVLNKLEANRKNIQKVDCIDTYYLEDGYNSAIDVIKKRLDKKQESKKKLKIIGVTVLNENHPERFAELLSKGGGKRYLKEINDKKRLETKKK